MRVRSTAAVINPPIFNVFSFYKPAAPAPKSKSAIIFRPNIEKILPITIIPDRIITFGAEKKNSQ
jgi:hypothetical protein